MAVQQRNSEMVDLLRADFVHKKDNAYTWAMLLNMYTMLPGITSFWSMGGISKDPRQFIGNNSYYDLANERLHVSPTLTTTDATLEVGRGSGSSGALVVQGTSLQSHFNYSVAEDTYLRGGKAASKVLIGDANSGGIQTGTGPFISFNTIGDGWKAFPYTNSGGTTWGDWGAPWQVGQYQKFGDWLMMRGLVGRSVGTGLVIGTLPVGYRPVNYVLLGVSSNDAMARLEVHSDGQVVAALGFVNWISIWAFVSLL